MQLLLGVMNLAVMIAIAAIIAVEKLWRRGPMLARLVGVASIAAGLFLFKGCASFCAPSPSEPVSGGSNGIENKSPVLSQRINTIASRRT